MTAPERVFTQSESTFCARRQDLVDEFVKASRLVIELSSMQTQCVIDGDRDFARFDVLLHTAREQKDAAKYLLITHIQEHHC